MRKNGYERYIETVYNIIKEWENRYWDHAYPEKVIARFHDWDEDGEPVVIVYYGTTGEKFDRISPEKELLGLPTISDVHKELQTRKNVKVSENTTRKCLHDLASADRIYWEKPNGRGGARRLGVTPWGLRPGEGGQVQDSLKIIEKDKGKLPRCMCSHIKVLENSLLRALKTYSDACRDGGMQADENYKNYLNKYFLEYTYQLRLLVKPPHTPTVEQFHEMHGILAGEIEDKEEWVDANVTEPPY